MFRRDQFAWALFEFARNPFYMVIIVYVFGPYFTSELVDDPVQGQQVWGYINAAAGLFTALLAPLFGSIADRIGRRKPWIAFFTCLLAPATAILWFAAPGGQGIGMVTIAIAMAVAGSSAAFSEVFHNAMLPTIVSPDRLGRLSGWGLGLGHAGSLLIFLVMLYAFILPADDSVVSNWLPDVPWFGLNIEEFEHERIAAPLTTLWLLVFASPFFLFTRETVTQAQSFTQATREGLIDLLKTLRAVSHFRNIATFLLARMLYNDGKVAIMTFNMIYASGVFGWDSVERLLAGILLTVFAVAGGICGGWMDDRIGSRRAVVVCIAGTTFALCFALSIAPDSVLFVIDPSWGEVVWSLPYFETWPEIFYLFASIVMSVLIASAYANSRALLARIAPDGESSKFFGLYALSGQVTTFVGPLLVAYVTGIAASQRAGFGSLLILLIGGLVLLRWVSEEKSKAVPNI